MSSFLDLEGVYDKTKRYVVRNWSDEDFTQTFGAESVYNGDKVIEAKPAFSITIKAGEMRELGQFEAYTFTKHFVNHQMYKEAAKLKEPKLIERAEMSINNKDSRKPFEDKTISEIEAGKETPFMEEMRAKIREEELAKINKKPEKVEAKVITKEDKKAGEFDDAK